MNKSENRFLKINDISKVKFILVLFVIVLAVSFSIPTLARYKNFINLEAMFNNIETWDGSIAESYNSGNGTKNDPYIISNAAELAYFSQELKSTNYANTYFKLSNHIVLNNGEFGYINEKITYTLDDTTFYLDKYTGNAYDNDAFSGNIISTINIFDEIEDFAGTFDGDYHTIYGLYLTDNDNEVALFNNLSGVFENVYFKNSLAYGGSSTAILANNVVYGEVNNISTDGVVISDGTNYNTSLKFELEELNISKNNQKYSTTYDLTEYLIYDYNNLIIKGNYSSTNSEQKLSINGTEVEPGEFTVDLGLDVSNIIFSIDDEENSDVSITNLIVEGTYNYPIAAGIVCNTTNSNFNNIMNKADVIGTNVSGLIGLASDVALSNAYNTGNLNGTNISSIMNRVVNNESTVIDKVYNTGNLSGDKTHFVGEIVNSDLLVLSNSFNTSELADFFGDLNGLVRVTNVYDVNGLNIENSHIQGEVNTVNVEQIDKELLVKTLGFCEYINDANLINNPNNIWIYQSNNVPILYIDELNNPIASLNVDIYSWNDLGYELEEIKFTEQKAFNITPLNEFSEIKEMYYFIFEGTTALNQEEISSITTWNKFNGIIPLDKEGKYIVYVKLVDQDDNVYYINTNVLFFDLYGPDITLSLGDESWNDFKDNLSSKNISADVSLNVVTTDKYSEVINVEYYISDIYIEREELNDLDSWIKYDKNILIENKGPNIVYVRAVDNNGHINIVNSDFIIYGGYTQSLSIGKNSEILVEQANITNRSSVTYRFDYSEDISYASGYNNNLVLSEKLPNNTIITFIDHKLNNIYSYVVDNDDTVIPLNKFSTMGNNNGIVFDDASYLVTDKKRVSVIFDFVKADINKDFSFHAYLDVRDNLGNVVLSTLRDTIKDTKVYNNLTSGLSIKNNSVIYSINYDSDSENTIEFEYSFDSLIKDNNIVNDTFYENMKSGIILKLVDDKGVTVDKKYLKNMEFIVKGTKYSADSDGVVRINMSDNLNKITGSINIVTHENDLGLNDGNYSLLIVPFIASDGKYSYTYSNSNISIPVVSDYTEIGDYEFNVTMDDSAKIIVKDSGDAVIPFEIVTNNNFEDANIRISLYKKTELTAYNQKYSLIDLGDYSNNELKLVTDHSYVINSGKFDLNLDLTNMIKTGYEVRFELFDGDRKISVVKKKIIVR